MEREARAFAFTEEGVRHADAQMAVHLAAALDHLARARDTARHLYETAQIGRPYFHHRTGTLIASHLGHTCQELERRCWDLLAQEPELRDATEQALEAMRSGEATGPGSVAE